MRGLQAFHQDRLGCVTGEALYGLADKQSGLQLDLSSFQSGQNVVRNIVARKADKDASLGKLIYQKPNAKVAALRCMQRGHP